MREVGVISDNWLGALRAARKALGEDGGVPPGASCVMSASGEVTILDAAKRLRYALTRSEAPAPATASPASRPESAGALAPVPLLARAATKAYSPEESAAARAGLVAAQAQNAVVAQPASEPAPRAFSPSRPSSLPPLGNPARMPDPGPAAAPKKQATVAYSPEEAKQVRKALEQARNLPSEAGESVSGTSPTDPAPPRPSLPQVGVGAPGAIGALASSATRSPAEPRTSFPVSAASLRGPAAVPPPAAHPPPAAAAPPDAQKALGRQTMAYSAAESASARTQLLAAQAAQASNSQALGPPRSPHELFGARQPILVTLGGRDEEPSANSPLTYRERSYFGPPAAKRAEIESALRGELDSLRRSLVGRARGQYVNLAVFDHAFHQRPERPPVATLQWKDWRGEASLAWAGSPETAQWQASPAQEPVKTSFAPDSPVMTASVPRAANLPRPGPMAATPQGVTPFAQPIDPFAMHPAPSLAQVPVVAPQELPPAQASARPQAVAPFFAAPTPHGVRDQTGDQDKRLAIAFEASQDLYFLATPAEGLDFAVKLLHELVPCEAISGCLYDINTDEFRFVAVSGVGAEERRAAAVRSTVGLFSVAVRSGLDSLVVRDVAEEPRYDPVTDGRTGIVARDMAFFALHKGDHLLGMLQLINRRDARGFTEGDLAVASYVAHQATEFLRSKRGLTGTGR